MGTSSLVIDKAQELAAAGRHSDVVQYLGARERSELEASPSLALLYGTAQARLGRPEEGLRWLDVALDQARKRDERVVERRALNARGATALVSGRIDEAADYFTQAMMVASREGDFATTGRCSNNVGVISNLRGRHAEAIGSWEIALAAFGRAGVRQGVAECRHNLGIAYREQGALDHALTEADRAVAEAESVGDLTLRALALRGRAEIHVLRGDPRLAWHELDEVRQIRSQVPHVMDQAEDLRVAAAVMALEGDDVAAERSLREVIERAEAHRRPELRAEATRDLAALLRRTGRLADAEAAARTARAIFTELGAEGEIRNLAAHQWDADFAAELGRSLEPLHEAQELADAGRYADLLGYLGGRSQQELEQSPMLALLCGIGHTRLGRLRVGQGWATVALQRARALGDRTLEVRALNVCGVIALERGGIDEATYFLSRAQEEAMHDNDMAAVGRCANNLGAIAHLQGDYPRAVGAHIRAIAACQKAHYGRGIAEAHHNLAIAYREQGQLDAAMEAADAAVREAERLDDRQLKAQALAGRAEILIVRGGPQPAIPEAGRALALHPRPGDAVLETEALRILAVALGIAGSTRDAEGMLREVIERATEHGRPLLVAIAQRDLAQLLAREGEVAAAKQLALTARAAVDRLGPKAEIRKRGASLGPGCNPRTFVPPHP